MNCSDDATIRELNYHKIKAFDKYIFYIFKNIIFTENINKRH